MQNSLFSLKISSSSVAILLFAGRCCVSCFHSSLLQKLSLTFLQCCCTALHKTSFNANASSKTCSPGFSLSHPICNFSACHFPYCDSYSKSVMSLLLCCCHSYNYCPFIFIALPLLFMHRDCFFCTLSIFLLIHFHLFHPFFMCPFYCSHRCGPN